ncbi:hypothetical protein M4951_24445 [Blastopirellula sp. J2-11]|uniref:hypothetical protein n=1 Tax=Blastopirellula sp. J2-11 TaxID=2943192 RepID=UPI0021CA3E66|nr:hypothetical protein [Blastopirellula sp. J2-11]UUO06483.1 hypothetical protein M4951_24445 [Blastopirellula sp. J2-11]
MFKSKWTASMTMVLLMLSAVGVGMVRFAWGEEEAATASKATAGSLILKGKSGEPAMTIRASGDGNIVIETGKPTAKSADASETKTPYATIKLRRETTRNVSRKRKDDEQENPLLQLHGVGPVGKGSFGFPYPVRLKNEKPASATADDQTIELEIVDNTGEAAKNVQGHQQYIDDLQAAQLSIILQNSSSRPRSFSTVLVPLDAATYSGALLAHNLGSGRLKLVAESAETSKEGVVETILDGDFMIRDWTIQSPENVVNLVELRVFTPRPLKELATDSETLQSQIDDLRAKNFRFVLKGLVPVDKPLPQPWEVIEPGTPAAMPEEATENSSELAVAPKGETIKVKLAGIKYYSGFQQQQDKGNRYVCIAAANRTDHSTTLLSGHYRVVDWKHLDKNNPDDPIEVELSPPGAEVYLVTYVDGKPTVEKIAGTARLLQAKIDDMDAKKFAFVLRALPNGEALPDTARRQMLDALAAVDPEQDQLAASAEPFTIQVPLDANTYPNAWLQHNRGNRTITLFAEGTGITKESVGVYTLGQYFAIRKMISESPGGGITLVTLEVLPGPGPGYSNPPAKFDATKLQGKIDELRGKKFRFLLQGLVPLGEPLPAAATMADSVQAYPQPTPYPRNVATPPQTTGGLGMASDRPRVDVPREPNRTQNIYFVPRTIPATASPNFSIPSPAGETTTAEPTDTFRSPSPGNFSISSTTAAPGPTTNAMPAMSTWAQGSLGLQGVYQPYPAPHAYGQAPTANVPPPWQAVPTEPGQPPISIQAFSATFHPLAEQKKQQAIAKLKQAKTDEEKAKARAELRTVLTEIFTTDMKHRDKQAKEIESRIKKLRDQYEARENAQDEIIDLQLQLLEKQAAGLEFPAR